MNLGVGSQDVPLEGSMTLEYVFLKLRDDVLAVDRETNSFPW